MSSLFNYSLGWRAYWALPEMTNKNNLYCGQVLFSVCVHVRGCVSVGVCPMFFLWCVSLPVRVFMEHIINYITCFHFDKC